MSLHRTRHGTPGATPVMFLHGLGTSSWMWDDQVRALAADHHCLTVDLPGNGQSLDVTWTGLADTAAGVARVIDDEFDGPAHVVGLSLGAYVALHLLADHPRAVASTVVSGVTTRPLRPRWLWRATTSALAPLLVSGPVATVSGQAMRLPEEARRAYRRDAAAMSSTTVRRVYDEVVDFTPPASLAERDQRLLVVAGGREAKAVRTGLDVLPAQMPHAVAAIAPDLHHGWNGEDPDLFTAMVSAWVHDQPLPTGLQLATSAQTAEPRT